MKRYDRLIFVTNSDTAVGPMAEALLRSKYLLEELEITSKGLVVLFPEPINPKAEAVLQNHGLTMQEHMSDALKKEDLDERTLIMTVCSEDRIKVLKEFTPEFDELVCELSESLGAERELFNPYGGSLDDYEQCFLELEALITKLVVHLNEEELLC